MIPNWATTLPVDLIRTFAEKYNLKPWLVAAIVMNESSGKPFKAKFEPHTVKYVLDATKYAKLLTISPATETMLQMTSWGLMQVMGYVAREHGYDQDLPMLCLPPHGLDIGCKHLAKKLKVYGGDETKAIAAYNRGSVQYIIGNTFVNQKYVDGVLKFGETTKTLF